MDIEETFIDMGGATAQEMVIAHVGLLMDCIDDDTTAVGFDCSHESLRCVVQSYGDLVVMLLNTQGFMMGVEPRVLLEELGTMIQRAKDDEERKSDD